MAKRAAAWAVGMAVLMTTGCAGSAPPSAGGPPGVDRSGGAPAVQARWESCASAAPAAGTSFDAGQDALVLPRLDDGFAPVAAVVCRQALHERPGGGTDMLAVEERADDVTALIAAVRLPDAARTDGACTMELPAVPWLAVLDAQGRWTRPGVPVDECGKPRREFRTAYDQLRLRRVSARVVGQVESDAAAASGCGQTWADMVWVAGRTGGGHEGAAGELGAGDAAVRVCVYRVPAGERGGDKPAGDFVSGRRLSAAEWAGIRRELAAAAPAAACTTPATGFAVVHAPAATVYVEADGCRRVLIESRTGPSTLRQAAAELTSLVLGG